MTWCHVGLLMSVDKFNCGNGRMKYICNFLQPTERGTDLGLINEENSSLTVASVGR